MKNFIVWSILILAAGTGCRPRTDIVDEPKEAPPAAAIAPIAGMPLDTALALLDNELRAAIDNKLDDTGFERFQRAEALTDRLLETRYPFQWLKGEAYALEAKLRQIQALADRVLAQIRASVPPDSAMPDLQRAHQQVVDLRQALRAGGGTTPPSLEKLLAGTDTANTPAAVVTGPDEGH